MTRTFLRRLPYALAIALGVSLLAGAGFGMAASQDGQGVPARFLLAGPMAGDAGSWETRLTQATLALHASAQASVPEVPDDRQEGSVTQSEPLHSDFEWLPEQPWRDGVGAWHAVHGRLVSSQDAGLTTTVNGETTFVPSWHVDWVETATGRLVGTTGLGGGGVSTRGGLLEDETMTWSNTVTRWDPDLPCGLPALLREGVDLDGPLQAENCGVSQPFRAAAVEAVNDVDAVRFDAHDEAASVSYWFNPGIPEALRVQRSERAADGGQSRIVQDRVLTSFTRGSGAWDTGLALPADVPLPSIHLAPRMPWGPDETGVEHPYPASLAWATARDDPAFRDFGTFLAAHPEAAAVSADYSEEHRGSTVERRWDLLVLADDGSNFMLRTTQTSQPPDGALADLLGIPSTAPPVVTHKSTGGPGAVAGYPTPSEMPAQAPDVASLWAYWQAWSGSEQSANFWGIGSCMQPCEDGRAFLAGRAVLDAPAKPLVGTQAEATVTRSLLAFAASGEPLHALAVDADYTSRALGLGPGPMVAGGTAVETKAPRGAILQGAISPWDLPPAAAAGVGFFAALSAALALLWPSLKAGPLLGLFSRLSTPHLLRHPVRAELMQRVEAQPGIHYQDLVRAVGKGKGAIEHHLRKLQDGGFLKSQKAGGYTCFFPVAFDRRLAAATPALKSEGARAVLQAIQANPGASALQVGTATGLARAAVHHHLQRLGAAGLVDVQRNGRSLSLQATPLAGELAAAGSG